MRRLMVVIFLIFCFAFGATAQDKGQANSNGPLGRVFEGRYAAMKAAMAARDGKAISELLAPDFTSEDVSGQKENADTMIQEVLALPQDPLKVSNTTILSVKVDGESATVDQRYDMKTTKVGPDGNKRDVELIPLNLSPKKQLTVGCVVGSTETVGSQGALLDENRPRHLWTGVLSAIAWFRHIEERPVF